MERSGRLRRRIEQWRRRHPAYARMPEGLWEAAVTLARRDGAYTVSRELGVNYATLRSRLRRSDAAGEQSRPRFVEINAAQVFGGTGTVLELERRDGAKLTVRLGGGQRVDVAVLTSAFLGQQT